MGKSTIEALIDGGKASPAPPLGPQLAMAKLNIGNVIKEINEKTKEYEGMKVPIKIIIDDTKDFEIEVGTPPASSLIRKELGLKKIASEKKVEENEEDEKEIEGKEKDGESTEKKKLKEGEAEKKEEEGKEEGTEEKGDEEKGKGKKKGKKAKKKEPQERVIVGDLTIDQCIKITKMKRENLLAKDMKSALKEIVATVVSMPLTIEGKSPKEILKEIDEGKYDDKIES
jgi:ribosomal protein L11